MKPAVFLDRDGVINEEIGFITRLEGLHIFPYVRDCIKELHGLGYYVIIISNQSGVARGYLTEEELNIIHDHIKSETDVDAIYYCPYYKDGVVEKYRRDSNLRKPGIGMIQQACKDYDIDMSESLMVGDRATDIKTGQNAGIQTILLESGYGTARLEEDIRPDYVMNDLRDVVEVLRNKRTTEVPKDAIQTV
ncbi:MAG: HAD-IIIA family hydrolase [Lachnospiraceae bacterium]|nr:HAD-IIIA family hydrolase [Lachnospiraceae bacterium]